MSSDVHLAPRETVTDDRSSAPFETLLGDFRTRLEDELRRFLVRKHQALTAEAPDAAELTAKLEAYVLRGGKRLRPALLYHAYRACGGSSDAAVLPAALAVELLHTYLLIHDDIMDHAETRRGGPTAHLVFRDEHRERDWRGSSEDHGRSAALLLGDLAHCYAEELLAAAGGDGSERHRARACWSTMCQEVITGQYLEFTAGHRRGLSEADLLQILRMKSGRYSVERPIQLGALLAGAGEPTLGRLSELGLLLGEAFQLHDDLLGMFGDRGTVGKPVGGDLVEGKLTILIHRTLERLKPDEGERLRRALGDPDLSAEDVERVAALIRSSGALDSVVEMIGERHRAAASILGELELASPGREFLSGVVDYLRERNR